MATFDVVIVGSGPAGLACLSGIQEPYSFDNLTESQRQRAAKHISSTQSFHKRHVAVIDPNPTWLTQWRNNFSALDITTLRSPALAHPDLFDQNALLAFATKHGRTAELVESGCSDISSLLPLGQSQVGLWKLPSAQLFLDFCQDMIHRLPHEYMCDWVVHVSKTFQQSNHSESKGESGIFHVFLKSGISVPAKAVILATGMVGIPSIPSGLYRAPNLISWTELDSFLESLRAVDSNVNKHERSKKEWHVLVVGGGLTSVQAALRCVHFASSSNNKSTDSIKIHTTLCSRRPLCERHFDLPLEWFNWRLSTKCMANFYSQYHPRERLHTLQSSRGGGSVPGMYMKMVKEYIQQGKLKHVVGNATYVGNSEDGSTLITVGGQEIQMFDVIINACGVSPDCTKNSLCQRLLEQWPVEVIGGYPKLSDDLEWTDNLFVVGGLASINVGPGAANLSGMRRAAQIVTNALDLRFWLRQCNVLQNPFHALSVVSSSSSDESDSESKE